MLIELCIILIENTIQFISSDNLIRLLFPPLKFNPFSFNIGLKDDNSGKLYIYRFDKRMYLYYLPVFILTVFIPK